MLNITVLVVGGEAVNVYHDEEEALEVVAEKGFTNFKISTHTLKPHLPNTHANDFLVCESGRPKGIF